MTPFSNSSAGESKPRKKTALVTGCSAGGLGYALAQALAESGYHVFATARDPSKAASLLMQEGQEHENTGCRGGASSSSSSSSSVDGAKQPQSRSIELLPLDVTSRESIGACAAKVELATGGRGLDVLINNAGAALVMPLLDTDLDRSRQLYEVNVWGMLAVSQAFSPMLIVAGGVMVNIASLAGQVQMAWQGVYNSSKAATTFISETLRIELEPLGVRVLTAMVGEVETNIYAPRHDSSDGSSDVGGGGDRVDRFELPPGSRYKAVEATIARQSRGELQVSNEAAESVARKLVADVVAGRRGKVWHGGVAGTAKYASWLLPSRLFEWLLHRERGVYQLKKE